MSRKRYSGLLVFALVLGMLLAGCVAPVTSGGATAPAAGEAAAPAGTTTLTWAIWGQPNELVTHQKAADAYMALHPDIKIEIWNQPWDDYFTKIQALWASGDAATIPDIAFLWPTPKYAAEGVLENLDPYVEKSGYNLEDYWPGLLDSAMYQGAHYGFPRDIEVNILYYNKDIFDEVGQAYPTDDWTWDDLAAAAEKLTVKDASGNVERYGIAMEGSKAWKFVSQNGGQILDDFINPSKCAFTDDASIQAIEFFTGLLDNGYAMRPADLSQAGGDAAVFQSGQTAMILQNTSRTSAFNAANMNYDVAPVPIPAGGKRWNGAGGAAWVMSSGSDSKDAAWDFLSWLQGADGGQKIYTEAGEIFPALQSVANSPVFLNDAPPANKQGILTEAAASDVGAFGFFPEWGEIDGSILGPGMDLVWSGEATAADQMPVVCDQINAFLAENGYPKQ